MRVGWSYSKVERSVHVGPPASVGPGPRVTRRSHLLTGWWPARSQYIQAMLVVVGCDLTGRKPSGENLLC